MIDNSTQNELNNFLMVHVPQYLEVITPGQTAKALAALGFLRKFNDLANEFDVEAQSGAAAKAKQALDDIAKDIKEALSVKAKEHEKALKLSEIGSAKIAALTTKKITPAIDTLVEAILEIRKIEAAHRTLGMAIPSTPDYRVMDTIQKLESYRRQELI